jgi:hypothetical protein
VCAEENMSLGNREVGLAEDRGRAGAVAGQQGLWAAKPWLQAASRGCGRPGHGCRRLRVCDLGPARPCLQTVSITRVPGDSAAAKLSKTQGHISISPLCNDQCPPYYYPIQHGSSH